MKTLYVSDLDGTLLRRDKTVSEFTVNTVNELTARGMLFSYATARSYVTASRLTSGITSHIPVIIYNGAFILENGTERKLLSEHMSAEDSRHVLDILLAHDIYPIVYAMIDGVEKYSYCPALESQAAKTFEDGRSGDVRANPVDDPADLYRGDIQYRKQGSLIAFEAGESITYGLFNAQERGTLFIGPGEKVYAGMVVSQTGRNEDIELNVCKTKHLTNTRSSSADEALRLTPKKVLSLEQALEFIDTDELLEVTPTSLRIRKKILDPTMRKRSKR